MSTERARQNAGMPRRHRFLSSRTGLRGAFLAAGVVTLTACTPLVSNHGYVPPQEDLDAILVGVDTRDTVADVIGAPSAFGVLSDSGYYYIAQKKEARGAFAPRVIEREVVAISFDNAGVVSNVERFGLEDGNVVALSRRVTDSNIARLSFIRQLLGNVGRISTGGADPLD